MEAKLKDKLLKLYELAKRGVKGEQKNAQMLLNKLLEKYNLSLEDISGEVLKKRYYKYTTEFNKHILKQVIFKVIQRNEVYSLRGAKKIFVECNDFEHVQILELADFHLENADKERKRLIKDLQSAYIQKHKLFRERTQEEENEEYKELTLEEKQAIWRMSNLKDILSNETYIKKLN